MRFPEDRAGIYWWLLLYSIGGDKSPVNFEYYSCKLPIFNPQPEETWKNTNCFVLLSAINSQCCGETGLCDSRNDYKTLQQ